MVAPMAEANEAKIVPVSKPNSAPPAKVKIAAPGRESAATSTYSSTNKAIVWIGLA